MKKVEFPVGKETLVGQFLGQNPSVLFLHGAGQATKERSQIIAEKLADSGIGSFSFDFSGHGESSGELKESSLKKRVEEAESALKFLTKKPISIICFSMGGHIALELLKAHNDIQSLILFYPGVYAAKAYSTNFTQEFSDIIRVPESWRQNNVMEALRDFTGNLLLVVGEKDAVVPSEVFDLIETNATKTKFKERIVISNAEHLFLPKLIEDEELFSQIISKIVNLAK